MDEWIRLAAGVLVIANVAGLFASFWFLKWREQQAQVTREALEAKDRLLATLRDEQKQDRAELNNFRRRLEIAERDLMEQARRMYQRERYLSQCEALMRLHKIGLPEEERYEGPHLPGGS